MVIMACQGRKLPPSKNRSAPGSLAPWRAVSPQEAVPVVPCYARWYGPAPTCVGCSPASLSSSGCSSWMVRPPSGWRWPRAGALTDGIAKNRSTAPHSPNRTTVCGRYQSSHRSMRSCWGAWRPWCATRRREGSAAREASSWSTHNLA